jgi:hypothetical protein
LETVWAICVLNRPIRSESLPKVTPPYLLALGTKPLPDSVTINGASYRLRQRFKHDFFAATALYEGDAGKIILKIGRCAPLFGIPTAWIGAFLARREANAFNALSDLQAIPKCLGRVGRTGVAHVFIEGEPLSRGIQVPDNFFDLLHDAINEIHARGMAYVDLEKPQNIIAGDDGRPYLIDFQICWHWHRKWGGELFPIRWLRARFQEGDRYHLLKMQRRVRPDQLTREQLERSYAKPFYVRLHRTIFAPFLHIRRAILHRIDPNAKSGERGRLNHEDSSS